jgi:hypothetical protein
VSELLTEADHRAMRLSAELMSFIARDVIGDGVNRSQDLAEAAAHIHGVQNMILAQAAARAYPNLYRQLGGTS